MSASRLLLSSPRRSGSQWTRPNGSRSSTPRCLRSHGRRRTGPEAPLVWGEHGANLCVDPETGDKAAMEFAFTQAAHVVRLEAAINRVTGVPMELRAAVGAYDEPQRNTPCIPRPAVA